MGKIYVHKSTNAASLHTLVIEDQVGRLWPLVLFRALSYKFRYLCTDGICMERGVCMVLHECVCLFVTTPDIDSCVLEV